MKQNIFILTLLPLLLYSCGSEEILSDNPTAIDATDNIRFEVSVNTLTRVNTESTSYQTTWVSGDAIGIYAVVSDNALAASGNYADNVKLSYDGSTWTLDKAIIKTLDVDALDFYAYYPYSASINPTEITHSVKLNQNEGDNFNISEFLYAKVEHQTSNVVQLNMKHALALVEVAPERKWPVQAFHEGAFTVTLKNAYTAGTLDWENGIVGNDTQGDITMYRVATTDGSWLFRALVPVQDKAAGTLFHFTQVSATNDDLSEVDMTYSLSSTLSLFANSVAKYAVTLDYQLDANHVYAVGDVYPYKGLPVGVVYSISSDGKNGMIVSLDEGTDLAWATGTAANTAIGIADDSNGRTNMSGLMNYLKSEYNTNSFTLSDYPAFAWVDAKNEAGIVYSDDAIGVWYLPAVYENIYTVSDYSDVFKKAGGVAVSYYNTYWSSTEDISIGARVVNVENGIVQLYHKANYYSVRAVSAF